MAILEVKLYGDSVLREHAIPIEKITAAERQLAQDMLETMYAYRGVGLAAPQVGVCKRIIVIDIEPDDDSHKPTILINPQILSQEGEAVLEEGCLSFPGIREEVKRPAEVVVEGLDAAGQIVKIEAGDVMARALQHEIDHLDGILFIDHFSRLKRKLLKNQLNKIKRGE
ncbi:MAG: peptide deformylase [Candidatus Poribacteria bacterium]